MMLQYMINLWQDSGLTGTSCIFRSDDKELWHQKIEEFTNQYKLNSSNSEIVTRGNYVIFSFTDSNNTSAWKKRFIESKIHL